MVLDKQIPFPQHSARKPPTRATMISTEELLKPISDDQPCGADLSADLAFQELETLMRGKEETQFSAGEEPDWRALRESCLELFGRTRDLRVAVAFCLAALKTEGFGGLKEAMTVLTGMVTRHWDAVHPRLDPDDNNDPTQRVNIISSLATPVGTHGDPVRFLERLRTVPVVVSPRIGKVTLADIVIAQGKLPSPEDKTPRTAKEIEAAFRDAKSEDVAAVHSNVNAMLEMLAGMTEFLTATIGAGNAPNIEKLRADLRELQKAAGSSLPGVVLSAADAAETGATVSPAAGAVASVGAPGEISSVQDVIEALDRICQYYQRHEPSSPIPHLLGRAKRLAGKGYMEIMLDLSPEAIAQLKVIFGERDEQG
jgi:type VI secretion system protein ImpA